MHSAGWAGASDSRVEERREVMAGRHLSPDTHTHTHTYTTTATPLSVRLYRQNVQFRFSSTDILRTFYAHPHVAFPSAK